MARVNFNKLISTWEVRLQKAFLESVRNITSSVDLTHLANMITAGDVEGAIRAVNLDPKMFRPFEKTFEQAVEVGGNGAVSSLPPLRNADGGRVVFQFGVRDFAAEQWQRNYSSTMITEITNDQRAMVRRFLTTAMEGGYNGRSVALDLVGRVGPTGVRSGGVIGLTSSQQQWVQNYADELSSGNLNALTRELRDRRFDKMVRRAFENGEDLTADQIDTMTTTYRNRALRYRGEAIGRSESITALHQGQELALEQAIQENVIERKNLSYIWRAAKDDRTRDSHRVMDGQKQPAGQDFVTGNGSHLRFPGDPDGPPEEVINCRCWREPSYDFFAGVE